MKINNNQQINIKIFDYSITKNQLLCYLYQGSQNQLLFKNLHYFVNNILSTLFIHSISNPNTTDQMLKKLPSHNFNSSQQSSSNKSQYHNKNQQQKQLKSQTLCKITVNFQNQEYVIPLYENSNIKELGLKLIVKLYENLNQDEFQNDFLMIHQNVCQILINKIEESIKIDSKSKRNSEQSKIKLLNLIEKYHKQTGKNKNKINSSNEGLKYFIKNYQTTKQANCNTFRQNQQTNQSASKYKTPRIQYSTSNLYEKGMKSIQKQSKKQTQNKQLKQRKQKLQCLFKPDISKTQNKVKSKQKKCVFDRLFENANEIQVKRLFKLQQLKNQECIKEKEQCKFKPKINNCSAEIMKIKFSKEIQENQRSALGQIELKNSNSLEKKVLKNNINLHNVNNMNFNSSFSSMNSNSTSQKIFKKQMSNKILEGLFDPNHYQNRMNKTLKKLNLNNKQNQFTFQPQISAGTQKLTQNYPNFDKRMKMYEVKRNEKSFFETSNNKNNKSLSKQSKKYQHSKSKRALLPRAQIYEKKKQKGINKYLTRIRTQPAQYDQEVNKKNIFNNNGYDNLNNYCSEIYKLDSSFSDDQSSFLTTITPQKLNQNKNKINNHLVKLNQLHVSSQQVKKYIFQNIFKHLTNHQQQLTSSQISNNHSIPTILKNILEPLTQELESMNTYLDCQQFVWSLQNLYQQLSIQERAILLAFGKKTQNYKIKVKNYDNLKHVKTEDSIFQLIE